MSKPKGFTLVELLVVIAITVLLLSVLMPAFANARKTASNVICYSNEKQLVRAWIIYADFNDGLLVGPGTSRSNKAFDWVQSPQDAHGSFNTSSLQSHMRGIRRGQLYPLVEDSAVYHCMKDTRASLGKSAYRTYSISRYMGLSVPAKSRKHPPGIYVAVKMGQVVRPHEKIVIVEEADTRAYNIGAWVVPLQDSDAYGSWIDPVAIWHNDGSNFAFVDGHVEHRRWRDKRTIYYSTDALIGLGRFRSDYQGDNVDLQWVVRHAKAR